jgi:hypothetical protein
VEKTERCRICAQPADSGLICKECRFLRRMPRTHYFLALILAPLAVPLVLLMISRYFNTSMQRRERLETIAHEMGQRADLGVDFDGQIRSLQLPCPVEPTDDADDRQNRCESFYRRSLKDLDTSMVKLAWTIDTTPVADEVYEKGADLKDIYWGNVEKGIESARNKISEAIDRAAACYARDKNCQCDAPDRACPLDQLRGLTDHLKARAKPAFCMMRIDGTILLMKQYKTIHLTKELRERLLSNLRRSDCYRNQEFGIRDWATREIRKEGL